MKIILDSRESALGAYFEKNNINIERKQLLIGDCHIQDEQDEIKMVIERKTLADLASSIHDGRWNEQKYRALSEYQGKLFYIIEINDFTDIFNYQPYRSNINPEALLSATTNLWINHNIPFIYLQGIEQVAKYIYKLSIQLGKPKKDTTDEYAKHLVHSILPKRRENMTPEHYFLFCLRGIPGISSKTASNISLLFNNIFLDFIDYIRQNEPELFGKKYKDMYGRALNKEVIKSLYSLIKN